MLESPPSPDAFAEAATADPGIPINCYGLLYIDRKRNIDANIKWSLSDPIAIYVGCASLLASSARACGMPFGLFTNDPEEVARIVEQHGFQPFPVSGLEFSRHVPPVKKFYSAHFKLDVMAALASGRFGGCCALIDVDTVFLRAMPPGVAQAAGSGFVVYDVSSGPHPQHFDPHIQRDLDLVAGMNLERPKWFGGEFLVATSERFRVLLDEVELCWPRYVENVDRVHHVGDEMPVSAALNRLALRGERLIDAGQTGVVARWWPVRTKYPQPAFEELESRVILHLPGDKKFLANVARSGFELNSFLADYKRVRRRSRAVRRLFDFLDPYYSAEVEKA